MTWQEYPNNRVKQEYDGFFVVKHKSVTLNTPITCPNCHNLFITKDDDAMYALFKCCNACAITWAYPNATKWNEGWRPSETDVIKNRSTKLSPLKIAID